MVTIVDLSVLGCFIIVTNVTCTLSQSGAQLLDKFWEGLGEVRSLITVLLGFKCVLI